MTAPFRLGTRRSALALAQAEIVLRRLKRIHPHGRIELVTAVSEGDRPSARSPSPDFTGAFERLLASERIDAAVHSAKDLPARTSPRFAIGAVLPRADPHDVLLARPGLSATALPRGARIGSSSLRRRAQLLRWRPDLRVEEMRGNLDRRLARLDRGEFDGIVVAAAGLGRLRVDRPGMYRLPLARFLPAPAQGALAVQVRARDARARRWVRPLDDPSSRACVSSERELAAELGGDCNLPLGALARARGGRAYLRAEVLSSRGDRSLAVRGDAAIPAAVALGRALGRRLDLLGAGALLRAAN